MPEFGSKKHLMKGHAESVKNVAAELEKRNISRIDVVHFPAQELPSYKPHELAVVRKLLLLREAGFVLQHIHDLTEDNLTNVRGKPIAVAGAIWNRVSNDGAEGCVELRADRLREEGAHALVVEALTISY